MRNLIEGQKSELGLMWQVEGTLGGEKHEAKKSYSKGGRSSLPYILVILQVALSLLLAFLVPLEGCAVEKCAVPSYDDF